jgi:hypothetical protein
MASAVSPLGSLSMARGCAWIDAGPDTAKIGSGDCVQVHHARLLAVIGVRKTFPHGLGRVEMWRGGVRKNISVAAPFVWRCLSGSTMAPFPHPAHRTGQADFPHPALGQDFTLSRATPSAASEPFIGVDRFPNLQVLHHVLRLS